MTTTRAPQAEKRHVPAHYNWPTIKVLTVPKGPRSVAPDEWCATFCRQTVQGRNDSRIPDCRTICIRKVFTHEVRNVLSFKRHNQVDAEGQAKYPLPAEGQPANLPRILGGSPPLNDDDDDEDENGLSRRPSSAPPKKNWQEGWYFWTTSDSWGSLDHLSRMQRSLASQHRQDQQREKKRAVWHEYEEYLDRSTEDPRVLEPGKNDKWFGHIVPPRPTPDTSANSLLFSLPPDLAIGERINNLLAPTYLSLSLLQQGIQSGEVQGFGGRLWEKAQSDEPYKLLKRGWTAVQDVVKNLDPPDGSSK